MFEVLAYLYDHYWHTESPTDLGQLAPQLSAQGFEPHDIENAMLWLNGLDLASIDMLPDPESPEHPDWSVIQPQVFHHSTRIYSPAEHQHLGPECLGFLDRARHSGFLPGPVLEIVIDRAMATPESPVQIEELRLMVMLIGWRFGAPPHLWSSPNAQDQTGLRRLH
jgi:Smg protein